MIHVGGYNEYIGGCSVHRRVTMTEVRDIMIYVGNIMSTSGFSSQRLLLICSPT